MHKAHNNKQLKAWSFRLYASKTGKLIPESKCNELMELIQQWAVKNDFEIDTLIRPKYTLEELIAKCDPEAPPVKHDWESFFEMNLGFPDDFMSDRELPEYQDRKSLLAYLESIDLTNDAELWKKVSQSIKETINTHTNGKYLSKALDEMNKATEKAENSSEDVFGFDETEYLLSSLENAKRLNRSIEQIEKGLAKKMKQPKSVQAVRDSRKYMRGDQDEIDNLKELAELTNKAKASIKRASESIERGIDDAESFLCTRANDEDVVHVTTVIKDGDDLIITIPDDILNDAGLKIGNKVNIEIDKHGYGFVITHAK